MNEGCLICGSPLEYSVKGELMRCELCGKEEMTRTKCEAGHYVCNDCHMNGLDAIIGLCLKSEARDPAKILSTMMDMDFCHMHGPEHHVMVGCALLAAYSNSGGEIDLKAGLREMLERGREVPGGVCGYWGACGAGISSGIFVSIITGADPLSVEGFRLSHMMTATALNEIGRVGGPRCCKRDSFLSVKAAVEFVKGTFGIEMKSSEIVCRYSSHNEECIGNRCPFSPVHSRVTLGS